MGALIEASEREGIWTLQAGIFPENVASIELHKRHDFGWLGPGSRLAERRLLERCGADGTQEPSHWKVNGFPVECRKGDSIVAMQERLTSFLSLPGGINHPSSCADSSASSQAARLFLSANHLRRA